MLMTNNVTISPKSWDRVILIVFLTVLSICISLIALGIALVSLYGHLIGAYLPITIGVLVLFVFGIGRLFIKYDISWGMPIGDIEIKFELSLWKKIILLGIPLNLGKIKAEIRYKYGDTGGWTFPVNGKWADTNEIWVSLERTMAKRLTIWQINAEFDFLQLDYLETPLHNEFMFDIRIKNENDEIFSRYTNTYQKVS